MLAPGSPLQAVGVVQELLKLATVSRNEAIVAANRAAEARASALADAHQRILDLGLI